MHTSESSSDTPNLVNVKRLDSFKRRQSSGSSETASAAPPDHTRQLVSQSSDDSQGGHMMTQLSHNKVSSKPPLNKRAGSKPGGQRPQLQGWLNKRKYPKLSASNTSLNSAGSSHNLQQILGSNGATSSSGAANSLTTSQNSGVGGTGASSSHLANTAALIRNHLGHKWKLYWSVLVKDYIAFYKNPDDRIPVDFLLLKDFSIVQSNRENGFVLVDRQKQLEHEFYTQTPDELKDWLRVRIIKIKLFPKSD